MTAYNREARIRDDANKYSTDTDAEFLLKLLDAERERASVAETVLARIREQCRIMGGTPLEGDSIDDEGNPRKFGYLAPVKGGP